MTAPRLVTRCDDLGSFRTATEAIRDACSQGIGRNISVMASTAHVAEGAALLADRTDICFGLHAVINCEWQNPAHRFPPVLPPERVPDLLWEDGRTLEPLLETIQERGAPVDQIMAEVAAQLARLRDLGFDIRYLDTHCGFGWMHPPGAERGHLNRQLSAFCAEAGLVCSHDIDMQRLPVPGPGIPALCQGIAAMEDDRTYLMIKHPCYDVPEMATVAHWGGEAGREGAIRNGQRLDYMHPDVLAAIAERGAILTRYDELS